MFYRIKIIRTLLISRWELEISGNEQVVIALLQYLLHLHFRFVMMWVYQDSYAT